MPCKFPSKLVSTVLIILIANTGFAGECTHRGVLEEEFCDENYDMVADSPQYSSRWRDPSTLFFTYSPVEHPAVYQSIFLEFQQHLAAVTGKKVAYLSVNSNAAEVEALRSGQLHIAGFATGATGYAVNLGGFVPIAVTGNANSLQNYALITITQKDSDIRSMADLKGKLIAHTSLSSNSGNLAPRALFPGLGLTPDVDYTVKYSGKHDQSIMGVLAGDYDAAPVASDVFIRMAAAGRINKDDFRILYTSPSFPTSAFGYAHDLHPDLSVKINEAFFSFRFSPVMSESFDGSDRFYPVTFKDDWKVIRDIAHATGTSYTRTDLKNLAKTDALEAAKKSASTKLNVKNSE